MELRGKGRDDQAGGLGDEPPPRDDLEREEPKAAEAPAVESVGQVVVRPPGDERPLRELLADPELRLAWSEAKGRDQASRLGDEPQRRDDSEAKAAEAPAVESAEQVVVRPPGDERPLTELLADPELLLAWQEASGLDGADEGGSHVGRREDGLPPGEGDDPEVALAGATEALQLESLTSGGTGEGKGEEPAKTDQPETAEAGLTVDETTTLQEVLGTHREQAYLERVGAQVADDVPPDDWKAASTDERQTMLEQANQTVRYRYGIGDRALEYRSLPWERNETLVYGYFESATGRIVLNDKVLTESDPTEAIRTVVHENRHAFQSAALTGDVEIDPDVRQLWQEARDDYPRGADFETAAEFMAAYSANALEVDAVVTEERVYNGYRARIR